MAAVAKNKGERVVVGFAAETDHVAENARKKLEKKNADLIVANDVTAEGAGFDVDTNVVTIFSRDGRDSAAAAAERRRKWRSGFWTKCCACAAFCAASRPRTARATEPEHGRTLLSFTTTEN